MPHGKAIFTAPAEGDLRALRDYCVYQDASEVAERLLRLIQGCAQMLADNPAAGRPRAELGKECRSFVVDPYLLVYRPIQGGIVVLRVPHTAQDIDMLAKQGGFAETDDPRPFTRILLEMPPPTITTRAKMHRKTRLLGRLPAHECPR